MRIAMSTACKQAHSLLNFPGSGISMESFNVRRPKNTVVFVMGATGTGKSKLSIDLATHFRAEIINSDKMQVYEGLDIATNKVTEEEMCGIPHHLLGVVHPDADFTAEDFRRAASLAVESIVSRDKLPIIVGGSNSYIEALVEGGGREFGSKYDCLFLWVNVSLPVLDKFVSDRVDGMVEAGLVDEIRKVFKPEADYSRGIRKAIGVPEFDGFLRAEAAATADEETMAGLLGAATDDVKVNTCKLVRCQLEKILRLRDVRKWNLHYLDATQVFERQGKEAGEAWEKLITGPAKEYVRKFRYRGIEDRAVATAAAPTIKTPVMSSAVAAATR
ncbi:PREDICTED: adenylate isopentenyltransferase 5, chloroplastic-like [Nelumbo nucifera]|uniref:adenylate dimethylallyltransferase (ADP/ATP-dependent) n=2 Tax=Nelumbo nucifera TaxID=4432 RepID=A0A1U7ZUQ8_NELNU|nr:PREDICTED: adenylate isopentenyltransferase 5, chloroplastic-like [Nelumbo nucifera]DAD19426.1 TPA_asm: hypothetical protein HUJ06_020889 [Nelumbo nucifera]